MSEMSEISDEEDCESFFLQPASSPYNLAEKVKEANHKLQDQSPQNQDRLTRIQFKENLIDYEPEFTSDDASSIKSEDILFDDEYQLIEEEFDILDEQLKKSLNLNSPQDQDPSINSETETESEICEELTAVQCLDLGVNFTLPKTPKTSPSIKNSPKSEVNDKPTRPFKQIYKDIDCKKHCIEHFKSPKQFDVVRVCPILKLRERKCCNQLFEQKLPNYTGLRSEYGLNHQQIRNKKYLMQKRLFLEEEQRKLLIREKEIKLQQNELIFNEWLKAINNRNYKQIEKKKKRPQTYILPKFPTITCGNLKKRRQSSSARVFIQIPQRFLENGLTIGDLFIKTNRGLNLAISK